MKKRRLSKGAMAAIAALAVASTGFSPITVEAKPNSAKTNWSNAEEWTKRHTVDDIYNMLADLEKHYPKYAELGSLGTTQNNNEIKVLTITNEKISDEEKTGIGWFANIHGDEREAGECGAYAAAWILENLDDPTVQQILEKHILYVVPILNPDSHNIWDYFVRGTSQPLDKNGDGIPSNDVYADITGDGWIGSLSTRDAEGNRTADLGYESKDLDGNGYLGDDSWASGADINRNFDFMWEEGLEFNGKSAGEYAASEVETQMIQNFMAEHPMSALASLHTGIQTVLYPWCYRDVDTSNAEEVADIDFMAATAEKMRSAFEQTAQRNFYTISSYKDYQTYCELIDYAYGTYGTHAYTIEVYQPGGSEKTAYNPDHDPADASVCAWNETDYEGSKKDDIPYDEFVEMLKANGLTPEKVKVTGEETTLAQLHDQGKAESIYVNASDRCQRKWHVPQDQDMMVAGAKDAMLQMIYAEGKVQDPSISEPEEPEHPGNGNAYGKYKPDNPNKGPGNNSSNKNKQK